MALLKVNEDLTTVSPEYSDFADVFFLELVAEFLKHTEINNYAIN